MAQAQAKLQGLAAPLAQAYPSEGKEPRLELGAQSRVGLSNQPQEDTGLGTLAALIMGFSLLVLVIACLNLANMLLAKGSARSKEMAIRIALGGQRRQVLRQLLAEGLVLSLAGGLGGLILAQWVVRLVGTSLNARVPIGGFALDAQPDFRVYGATLGFCVLSTLLFALGPALRLSRPDLAQELKGQLGEAPVRRRRLRWLKPMNILVVGQVALSLAMLTAAGLLFRGAMGAARSDPGFPMRGGVVAEVDAGLAGYGPQEGLQVFGKVLDSLRAMPDVEAASLAFTVPFGGVSMGREVLGAAGAPEHAKGVSASSNQVADHYFGTLGVPLLQGRDFLPGEAFSPEAPPVAIIDRSLAEKLWPGQEPLGRWIRFAESRTGPSAPYEVVGVVPTLKDDLLDKTGRPHVYTPFGRDYQANAHFHIRVRTLGAGTLRSIRERIRSVDASLPVLRLRTLQAHREADLILWFFQTLATIFTIFGLLALFLAAVGLYGVKSQVVALRTREFGVRMAIGASPGSIQGMVLGEGLLLTSVGLGFGLLLAFAAGLLLRSILYEVRALDPLTFALAPAILLGVGALASFLPALRAARIQPNQVLRGE